MEILNISELSGPAFLVGMTLAGLIIGIVTWIIGLKQDMTHVKKKNNGTNELAESMTAQIKELSGQIDDLSDKLGDQSKEITSLRTENTDLKARVTHLEKENERKDKIINDVQTKLIAATEERDTFRENSKKKDAIINDKEKHIIQVEAQIQVLKEARAMDQDNALKMIDALGNALGKVTHVVKFANNNEPPPDGPKPPKTTALFKDDDGDGDEADDDKQKKSA